MIKDKIGKFVALIKRNKIKSTLLALVLVMIVWNFFGGNGEEIQDIQIVRGNIVEEIAVTGKTKAASEADLAFERGGVVSSVSVDIGAKVTAGQTLARLRDAELLANLRKAQASLAEEEVALAEKRKEAPNTAYNAEADLVATLRSSYSLADNAVRNNVDQFFKNKRQSSTYIEFTFTDVYTVYSFPIDQNLKIDINQGRYKLELMLSEWNKNMININSSSDLTAITAQARAALAEAQSFLNKVTQATNALTAPEYKYETTISGYRSDVAQARTDVNTALSNLISAENEFKNAPTVISTSIGSGLEDVLSQEARVAQFRAAVDSAAAALEQATIRSPINGVVTKRDIEAGETVISGASVISVISDEKLEIEADISEVHIGKVTIGNTVGITFDAFPNRTFTGEIFYIEPAETVIDGVAHFKIKVRINEAEENLRSGLTANLKIKTSEKQNVLKVPSYSVEEREGIYYVQKLEGKETNEVPVTLGLRGNDGSIELISGLSEGDMIRYTGK